MLEKKLRVKLADGLNVRYWLEYNTIILQDVITGGNWAKGTYNLYVLLPIWLCLGPCMYYFSYSYT